jgi:hypothetical protein
MNFRNELHGRRWQQRPKPSRSNGPWLSQADQPRRSSDFRHGDSRYWDSRTPSQRLEPLTCIGNQQVRDDRYPFVTDSSRGWEAGGKEGASQTVDDPTLPWRAQSASPYVNDAWSAGAERVPEPPPHRQSSRYTKFVQESAAAHAALDCSSCNMLPCDVSCPSGLRPSPHVGRPLMGELLLYRKTIGEPLGSLPRSATYPLQPQHRSSLFEFGSADGNKLDSGDQQLPRSTTFPSTLYSSSRKPCTDSASDNESLTQRLESMVASFQL